jgi:hypothetical protein
MQAMSAPTDDAAQLARAKLAGGFLAPIVLGVATAFA